MLIKYNKRCFTLIEIVIVMLLIGIALGALSLQISKAMHSEKFERGVEQIISRFNLAQELMLDLRTDVVLTLQQEEKNITCNLVTLRALPEYLEKSINRYCKITGITGLTFDGVFKKKILIYFDSSLGTITQGILTLSNQNKKTEILLKGYPSQLGQGKIEQKKECTVNYPEEILFAI